MEYYYAGVEVRSHAFILERRMKDEGVSCEITYMPREIMTDLCNLGVKFQYADLNKSIDLIRRSGLPECKVYKEVITPERAYYYDINI
ncbi:DUF3343 domain-containing protein [Herbivorax sp. ANBcel31]|uniref:DUF3343 domain-containing protein n=1 Tax=Herbivorax sp. ANBcel31 TaxID=3069754 RepID=UPI0027B82C20|nr:DUF3343 domain-containing protein [Herbivorax sp. ANBcel31]MDQ2085968.1 DUF3343 domain-containing protein [Herbivorax sp. ANBcel31]